MAYRYIVKTWKGSKFISGPYEEREACVDNLKWFVGELVAGGMCVKMAYVFEYVLSAKGDEFTYDLLLEDGNTECMDEWIIGDVGYVIDAAECKALSLNFPIKKMEVTGRCTPI